jgi:hypothetical protein
MQQATLRRESAMRALTIVICLFLALPASAQETTPVVELAAGYSLLQTNDATWSGWLASGSVSILRGLGIEAEASKNFFSEEFAFEGQTYSSHSSAFFIGTGPRFVARKRRASSFARVLVGAEKLSNDYHPSLQFGTGGDVWITNMLAVRGGIDGRVTWYEDESNGAWRFCVGAVVGLGSR